VVASLTPEHLCTLAAEVATSYSLISPSHSSSALARLLMLWGCVLSARNSTAPETECAKEGCEVKEEAAMQAEVVASLSPEHLLTFAAEVATPCSSPPPSHCSSALAQPLILRSVLSQHAIREAHVSEHHPRSLRAAASLPGIEGPCLDTPGHLPSAQCYHKSSTLFHCKLQSRTCCLQHCLNQFTVCEQTCCAAGMQLQERSLNTAAWFVNAIASVKMRARTRQAHLVLVQLAK